MQIDFTKTAHNEKLNRVEFLDENWKEIYWVSYETFRYWVSNKYLSDLIKDWDRSGKSFEKDVLCYSHNAKYYGRFEDYLVDEYIDSNWTQLTYEYHNQLSEHGFKSNNTYSQKGQILC